MHDEANINYLRYGATGFIMAHEISHIVNQIVSYRHTIAKLNLGSINSLPGLAVAVHRSELIADRGGDSGEKEMPD